MQPKVMVKNGIMKKEGKGTGKEEEMETGKMKLLLGGKVSIKIIVG